MVVVLSAAMVYIVTSAVTITIHSPQSGSVPGLTLGHGAHHGSRGHGGFHIAMRRGRAEPLGQQQPGTAADPVRTADPVARADALVEPQPHAGHLVADVVLAQPARLELARAGYLIAAGLADPVALVQRDLRGRRPARDLPAPVTA